MELSAQLKRLFFEQVSLPILCYRENGRFLDVNLKAAEILGYSCEELRSMDIFDIDPSLTIQKLESWWQTKGEATTESSESIFRRKDGTTFPVEIATKPMELNGKTFAVSFVTDVSDRKRIEGELEIAKFIFEKATYAIYHIDSNGKIINANEYACHLLGYSCEELCSMSVGDLDPTVAADKLKKQWDTLLKDHIFKFETLHWKKDGTTVPVEVISNLFRCNDKCFAVAFVQDISERTQSEIENEKIKALLMQRHKMEALGTLAGGIAHDFNNILSAITGYAELTKLSCQPNSKNRNYLEQLFVAIERAKDLVMQILQFSRQNTMEKKPTDLSHEVAIALKLVKVSTPKHIKIREDIPSDLGSVMAQKTQIHQVVMNLCSNALYAMKTKGGILEVSLSPVLLEYNDRLFDTELRPGQYLKLRVEDTGHGMDEDTLSHIFEPYFTTKPRGEGNGMGLSTVHGIIKAHGGDISVESRVGFGTKFEALFPVVHELTGNDITEPATFPKGNETILLVDDELALVEIGKDLLQRLGYRVETRMNPYDAIEAFRARPKKYDLVLTDVSMPHMNGAVLAGEIKAMRPDIPIIICSGFSSPVAKCDLKRLGIRKILMKPVNFHELANAVRNALDQREKDLD